MESLGKRISPIWVFFTGLVLLTFVYTFQHYIIDVPLIGPSGYNSYSLQAWAWRDGHIALGRDYSWLELAVYEGDYYVSFPPVPTIVFYLLSFIFPRDAAPDNLLMLIYTLTTYSFIYFTAQKCKVSPWHSLFWAFFICLGSSFHTILTSGGVWYQAQALSMALCSIAVFLSIQPSGYLSRIIAMALLALAVGCRPFQIFFFPLLLALYFQQDQQAENKKPLSKRLLGYAGLCIIPALIGASYMAYNYVRFGNVFEFGHNYLPEFVRAQNGQFSFDYVLKNVERFVLGLPDLSDNGDQLLFGFSFLLSNPVYILLLCSGLFSLARLRLSFSGVIAVLCLALWLLALLMHKSFGGFQFGARYTMDALPFVMGLLLLRKRNTPNHAELALGFGGMALNVYGAILLGLSAT